MSLAIASSRTRIQAVKPGKRKHGTAKMHHRYQFHRAKWNRWLREHNDRQAMQRLPPL